MQSEYSKTTVSEPTKSANPPAKAREPRDPLTDPIVSDPGSSYWGAVNAYNQYVQVLPLEFDDALQRQGSDLYWRMLLDGNIWSTITLPIRNAVLERLVVEPPRNITKDDPDWGTAVEIADLVGYAIDGAKRPRLEWGFDLGLARGVGAQVAVPIYRVENYRGATRTMLDDVVVKPQDSYMFVVDRYRYWWGIVGRNEYGRFPLAYELERNPELVVQMERIMHSAWGVRNHDPRGTSLCRPMYTDWLHKINMYPAMLANAATFGRPGIKMKVDNGSSITTYTDPSTGAKSQMTRADAMARIGRGYANGGVLVMGITEDAAPFEPQGDGGIFERLIGMSNRNIAKAGTGQTMATEETAHYSKGGGGTHENVLDVDMLFTKLWLANVIRDGLAKPLTYANWDRARYGHLVPRVSLGHINRHDFAGLLNAFAQARSATFLQDDQLDEACEILGLHASELDFEKLIKPGGSANVGEAAQPGGEIGGGK